jgi:hypothetical protein
MKANRNMNTKYLAVVAAIAALLVTVVAVLIGGSAITPGYGQANPSTTRFSVPFESAGLPLCGGEEVQFSGIMNFVFHTTIGPDGEFQYDISHVNFQGVSGVTTSGDRVVLTEVDSFVTNVRQISANEFMTEIHGTLITQGKGINTVVELLFHTTINANGQVTANVEHVDEKCVG